MAMCTVKYATMYVGASMIRLHSIKSSLPSLYPLYNSCDKLVQTLSHFSVLPGTESRVGSGNEASTIVANDLHHGFECK